MRKLLICLVTSILFVGLFSSCSEDDSFDPNATGEVEFSCNIPSKSKFKSVDPYAIILTIKDVSDQVVYSNKEIELLKMNDQYITAPISLKVGEYFLTDFIVVDSDNNVLYATPKEGSEKAYLVNDPLDIEFTIVQDNVLKISPEVVSTENITPEEFGYCTFSLNVVETFNFLTTVFIYDDTEENFILTDSRIIIKNNTDTLYDDELEALTNLVTVNSEYDTYDVTILKDGFNTYNYNFTKDSLKQHFSNPLTVVLSNENLIIMQPGADKGKDAYLGSRTNNNGNITNYGTHPGFISQAWTADGESVVTRGLIEFDLSSISVTTIKSAKLYLYAVDNASNGVHSQQSGSNEAYLQRVTSSWDEMTVTWDSQPSTTEVGQIYVPSNDVDMQDYIIDVTSHIQDMINNPSSNYGFMIRLVTEEYYRRLVFGSSDNPIHSKRPKLVIAYE